MSFRTKAIISTVDVHVNVKPVTGYPVYEKKCKKKFIIAFVLSNARNFKINNRSHKFAL